MATKDSIIINVSFIGDDVRTVLEDNHQAMRSVWGYCAALANATIKVHVAPRIEGVIEWHLDIVTPYGRRSMVAYQRTPVGAVSFTPD